MRDMNTLILTAFNQRQKKLVQDAAGAKCSVESLSRWGLRGSWNRAGSFWAPWSAAEADKHQEVLGLSGKRILFIAVLVWLSQVWGSGWKPFLVNQMLRTVGNRKAKIRSLKTLWIFIAQAIEASCLGSELEPTMLCRGRFYTKQKMVNHSCTWSGISMVRIWVTVLFGKSEAKHSLFGGSVLHVDKLSNIHRNGLQRSLLILS